MSQFSESNLALFIDFDNVAIGARDSRQRFDVRLLLQRVLEKGKVVVKRAYADWHYYKEHMTPLHEAAIELIEVPTPKISGKNSADIRLVVDAIDLCYAKGHIDTFVIVSGDSDFSPLVSKLRENDKRVIGIGVRSSSSHLLIANCDEFIFYDDIYNTAVNKLSEKVSTVPQDLRQLFDFLLQTTQSLLQESRGVLYSSLIKDTMKRKQPEFNETNYGYTTFGELLEDARDRGLLEVERDSRAGGTLVVLGLGKNEVAQEARSSRSRRRRRDRQRKDEVEQPRDGEEAATEAAAPSEEAEMARDADQPEASGELEAPSPTGSTRNSRRGGRRRSRKKSRTQAPGDETAPSEVAGPAGVQDPRPEAAAAGGQEGTTAASSSRTAKKTAKKTVKKAAKKTSKKTAKATTKKTATKATTTETSPETRTAAGTATRKTTAKTGKKTAKKSTGKTAKKTGD